MKSFFMFVVTLTKVCEVFGNGEKVTRGNELFNFIEVKFFTKVNKSESLVKDKCTIKLIKETISQFGSTYVYITDDRLHEELVRNLQINFVHSYFLEPKSLKKSKFISFYNLQIFQKKFKFQEIIKQIQPLQSSKFFILVRNRQEIMEKFKILWSSRLVNVVGCYSADGCVFCYTYFPYSPSNCNEVGQLHLVRKCDIKNGFFSLKRKLFPKKVEHLHHCPINITFTENMPSSYYTVYKTLTGWEIDLLNEIIERMKGVPVYKILPPTTTTYRTSVGYRRLLKDAEIGGGLVVSLRGLIYTDFCMYGKTLCTTWIVPRKENGPHSMAFLVKVFPLNVWILLFLVYLTMACTIKLFYGSASYYNILFKLLPFLLTNSTRTKKISRALEALWLGFCLLMNSIYQSGYQSTLLVPNSTKQISTTKEVLESNLKIFGTPDVTADAMIFFKEKSNITGRRLPLINRRLSGEEWVYRMTVKKDSAFLGFKQIVQYHIDRTDLAGKLHIPENCIINYFLAFVLKKNSHLTENVVKYASRLNENGFLEYFIRKHSLRKSRRNISRKPVPSFKPLRTNFGKAVPPPINFDKLFVVFMLYLSGNTLALVMFVIETKGQWDWKKIKKAISKELESAWTYKD